MMTIQEVRWLGIGETTIDCYTFLWSSLTVGTPQSAGVTLALDQSTVASMILWYPISKRLLMGRFKHSFGYLLLIEVG